MQLPFRTKERLNQYLGQLNQSSFTQLATIASNNPVADATVVWIFALLAQSLDASTLQLRLEFLESVSKVVRLFDPREIKLVPAVFAKLLGAINDLKILPQQRPLKLWLFHTLAQRLGPKLTIAHIFLVRHLGPTTQRYGDCLMQGPIVDYDPRYGMTGTTDLYEFFDTATKLCMAWDKFPQACLYAKCALSVCNTRQPLTRLYARAVLLDVIVHRRNALPVPGYLVEIMNIDTSCDKLLAVQKMFSKVSGAPSLKEHYELFQAAAQEACVLYELGELAPKLEQAYQIAWLNALHTKMPRCSLAQVEHCSPHGFDPLLLEHGYTAQVSVDAHTTVFERGKKDAASQWKTLDLIIDLTRRLSQVRALAEPVHQVDMGDEELMF